MLRECDSVLLSRVWVPANFVHKQILTSHSPLVEDSNMRRVDSCMAYPFGTWVRNRTEFSFPFCQDNDGWISMRVSKRFIWV